MTIYAKFPKVAGIYKFRCKENDKVYIGKSVNIKNRIAGHYYTSRKTKGNYYFENALVKYGWESFDIEILELFENFDRNDEADKTMIFEREAYYISKFDAFNQDKGYNICKFSTDRTGIPVSDITKKKIGDANRGRFVSNETREKLRISHMGKVPSEETRKKMGDASKGNKRRLGHKASDETKLKMSQSRMGRVHSEESKEKMRKPKVNKENLGKSFLGRKHSEESKEKMRQAKLKQKEKHDL